MSRRLFCLYNHYHIPDLKEIIYNGKSDYRTQLTFNRVGKELNGGLVNLPITSSLEDVLKQVREYKVIGLDFEWDGITNSLPHSVGLASWDYCIGLEINPEVITLLKKIFTTPSVQVVGHNIVADVIKAIDLLGCNINCTFLDTLILERVLEHPVKDSSLEDLAYYKLLTEDFKYSNDIEFFTKPSKELLYRTAGDAWTGLMMSQYYYDKHKTKWERGQYALELDMDMVLPVAYMIHGGITVDMDKVKEYNVSLRHTTQEYLERGYKDYDINIGSASQVLSYLQDNRLQIGDTREETLKGLSHPLAELVLKYRKDKKFHSSYLVNLEKFMDKYNKIHPNFKISATNTGRLAITKPAIQTVPPQLRSIFKSNFGEDGLLVEVDASQSELRCLGYLANSKYIIDAYAHGTDFHTLTAELAGIERRDAKTLNFAKTYGSGDNTLVNTLIKSGIDKNKAYGIIKDYNKAMNKMGVTTYQNSLLRFAKTNNYIRSISGRVGTRLNPTQVVNYPVQSFSSDLNKKRIIEIFNAFKDEGLISRVWLEFHDAAHLDVYKPEYDKVVEIINNLDTKIPDLNNIGVDMDLPLDMKVKGTNWGD